MRIQCVEIVNFRSKNNSCVLPGSSQAQRSLLGFLVIHWPEFTLFNLYLLEIPKEVHWQSHIINPGICRQGYDFYFMVISIGLAVL